MVEGECGCVSQKHGRYERNCCELILLLRGLYWQPYVKIWDQNHGIEAGSNSLGVLRAPHTQGCEEGHSAATVNDEELLFNCHIRV